MTTIYHDRLQALRSVLSAKQLDGVVIWRGDMFQGEEVRACDERLAMISGFTGSAGYALILQDKAFVLSDGRYHLQMAQQIDNDIFQWRDSAPSAITDILSEQASSADGLTLGYDAQTTTLAAARRLPKQAGDTPITWRPLAENPLDSLWHDRPSVIRDKAYMLADDITGKSSSDKLAALQATLAEHHHDGIIISATDCVNWLFNMRGNDLANTPFHLCFAYIPATGTPHLIEGDYDNLPSKSWQDFCASLPSGHYSIDPQTLPMALYEGLKRDGITFTEQACPLYLPKACKNAAELDGFAKAHLQDAIAVCSFWHWLEACDDITSFHETDLVEKLQSYRASSDGYLCDSFDTIMGSGENGAIIHYRALKGADSLIQNNTLLLIDSGAHYKTGTTDITRTFIIGAPDDEMTTAYSAVLAGHIALAKTRFPLGTNGTALDAICRAPLWARGLDYAHGTGHGVGHILSVHEGPSHISKRPSPALAAGMVLSNEPGYYEAGKWGIRLENLIAIEAVQDGFLAPQTLTFVPFESRLIDTSLLDAEALQWLNDYHHSVYELVSPHLSADMAHWLAGKCAPLS